MKELQVWHEHTRPGLFVFVRSTLDAVQIPVEVDIDATVGDLLNAYERSTKTPGGRLVFQDARLSPDDTLADCGVCPQCVVEYYPRPRGWKPRDNLAFKSAIKRLCTDQWKLSPILEKFLVANQHPCAGPPASFKISDWDTSDITAMDWIFSLKKNFNEDISGWNTQSVEDMTSMFDGARSFNQDISGWDTRAVTSMVTMFSEAKEFNQDIGAWNTAAVTDMRSMFERATAFNQDLGKWNVGKVTDVRDMFMGAAAFNQTLRGWVGMPGCRGWRDIRGMSVEAETGGS